jgi:hypothetical protein
MDQTNTVLGLFNNHFEGYGPTNALQMLELMDQITQSQKQQLNRMLDRLSVAQTSLDEF